jgi:hypothetical protein
MGVKTALFWMRVLSTGYIGIRDANPRILEDSYWLLLWKAFTLKGQSHEKVGEIRA